MLVEKKISRAVRVICASGLVMGAGLMAQAAYADDAVQRVEITGSSIKRIAKEGALPVQTLSNAEIQKTGAKNVEDLVQGLPAMQGFTASSESVNGGGGGVQNASIHSIGAGYTLVLLNGRRIASYGSGSAVNLSSIPITAVERVEVLTDGASALYGSDAIAGVVNFILKKNQTDAIIEATFNKPQQNGGSSSNFSISKGFGNLESDRFNVLVSYAHDEQKELNASQREFAKSGLQQFTEGGKRYSLYQLAVNTSPASVTLSKKDQTTLTFSPNYLRDGKCAPNTSYIGTATDKSCWFDYAATVMLLPESKRDSLFGSLNYKINDDTSFFAEAVASRFSLTGRFAPPAQVIGLSLTDPAYLKNVAPYLATLGVNPADVAKAQMNLRLVDAGGRANEYKTDAKHIAMGVNGVLKGYDYTVSYVHSENKQSTEYAGGFMSRNKYLAIKNAGGFDPFAPAGSAQAALAPAILHENQDKTTVKLDVLSVRGSGEIFNAPGGMAQLGVGADLSKQSYAFDPSAIAQGPNPQQPNFTDTPFGSAPGALPVDASRKNWGTFAELLVPVFKNLDVTAAVRYDSYDAVKNGKVFDLNSKLIGAETQGNENAKATYKLSAVLRPTDKILLRGSYGTGFKVADMEQITKPVSDFGVTSGKYNCPVKAPDPRAADCKGNTQYDLLAGGNALKGDNGLKPEESKQWTLGFRLEPTASLSVGLDLWNVQIKNQIDKLPETYPFANPAKYNNLFSTVFDAGQGQNKLATLLPYYNLADANYRGIDWDNSFKTATPLGALTINWTGTYMLNADFQVPGTEVENSVGRFDSRNNVVFRVITRVAASLKQSDMFTHTVAMNYRSGYHDQVVTTDDGTVKAVNADGTLGDYVDMKRDVSSYMTFDWQTRAQVNKALAVTVGIKNLFNVDPPFSVRTAGGGNQIGFDGRYASPLGRQIYVTGNYRF
ncbi:TonB-dependent receptor domain-containing protein [Undibacterium curvum]|uniref:TonB-dependent receptor n=1 Tax=Undibacterium curvum TaxID=2762294 RepID=A0ABR7A6L7_9BURK|nr:TonB-dependent receptor [Undibacterium curvum]MBC3932555.1 TonB-dependent receptor [Undibacterium curvum]